MKRSFTPSDKKAPIDKEALWGDISSHPDFPRQKKRNRSVFFFLMFSALVIPAIGLLYYSEPSDSVLEVVDSGTVSHQLEQDAISEVQKSKSNERKREANHKDPVISNLKDASKSLSKSSNQSNSKKTVLTIQEPTTVSFLASRKTSEFLISDVKVKPIANTITNKFDLKPPILSIPSLLKELDLEKTIPYQLELREENENKTSNWSLGWTAGVGMGFHDINILDSTFVLDVFETYKKRTETYAFGLYLERRLFNSKWHVTALTDFSFFYTEFEHEATISEYRILNQSESPYYEKFDSTNYYNLFHRHQIWDAQIQLGRNLQLSSNSQLSISAGIGFNLYYKASGNILEQNELSPIPEDLYKKSLKPFYSMGLSYTRLISEKLRWSLGASFQASRELSSKDHSFEHNYIRSNLYTSIGYNF